MTFEKIFLLVCTVFLWLGGAFIVPVIFFMAFYADSGSQSMNTAGILLLVGYPALTVFLSYRTYKAFRPKPTD